jgi:salicylate hydroxylase
VEDGFLLGFLFSKISSIKHIPKILNGYNELRRIRVDLVSDRLIAAALSLPPGPERDARNQAYSFTLHQEEVEDEILAQLWHQHIKEINYDPRDAALEWWHTWGRHLLDADSGILEITY